MKIIANETDYLIIYKENGVPSSVGKLPNSACEQVFAQFPEIKLVNGKNSSDGGLVHRIDTETSGLLLFAKNQQFYDKIQVCQANGSFIKQYTAYCTTEEYNQLNLPISYTFPLTVTSYFRSFGKKGASVKPVFMDSNTTKSDKKKSGSKLYTTTILSVAPFIEQNGTKLFKVVTSLSEGFRHQVRTHLKSQGLPIFGDKLYSPIFCNASKMLFFASQLSFFEKNYSLRQEEIDEIAKSVFEQTIVKH